MKSNLLFIIALLIVSTGCAGVPVTTEESVPPRPVSEMRFSKDYDAVWAAAIKTLPDVPVLSTDKGSGQIVGNWKKLKDSKRERLDIRLIKTNEGTTVSITSHVEVLIKRARVNTGFGTTVKMPMWKPVPSETPTPKQLFLKINEQLNKKPPEPEGKDSPPKAPEAP